MGRIVLIGKMTERNLYRNYVKKGAIKKGAKFFGIAKPVFTKVSQ